MSKDADLESDSPVSRRDLDESKDDIKLADPTSGHCSFELQNYRVDPDLDNTVFVRQQNREGGEHEQLHKFSPPSCSSHQLLSDNHIQETVSESSLLKAADLVRQPSRWGG